MCVFPVKKAFNNCEYRAENSIYYHIYILYSTVYISYIYLKYISQQVEFRREKYTFLANGSDPEPHSQYGSRSKIAKSKWIGSTTLK